VGNPRAGQQARAAALRGVAWHGVIRGGGTVKKWITILSGVLAVQAVLAVTLNLRGEDYGTFKPQEKLLAFDATKVDEVRISDGDHSLELRKHDGQWQLPESSDFPADQAAVQRLLEELGTLHKGWPVATTAGALKRFKVDDKNFERKVTLLSQDKPQATLYVGTSPGFRKVNARPDGDSAVYSVAFNTYEANPDANDWIDKSILKLDAKDVARVEMPGFTLQRDGDTLQVANLKAKEQTNEEAAGALLESLATLHIDGLLGTKAEPDYHLDKPDLEVKVTRKDGDVLDYRFSKPANASYYVLKRSDLGDYFKLAGFAVKPIRDEARDKLVQAKVAAEAKPAPPVQHARADIATKMRSR